MERLYLYSSSETLGDEGACSLLGAIWYEAPFERKEKSTGNKVLFHCEI